MQLKAKIDFGKFVNSSFFWPNAKYHILAAI